VDVKIHNKTTVKDTEWPESNTHTHTHTDRERERERESGTLACIRRQRKYRQTYYQLLLMACMYTAAAVLKVCTSSIQLLYLTRGCSSETEMKYTD